MDDPGRAVRLAPYDPRWAGVAAREGERLRALLGPVAVAIEHIGSTAIPGIVAKPVIDLLGMADSLRAIDARRATIEAAGYDWRGEYGITGRRYCTLSDPRTGRRTIHLHWFARGADAAARHIAFRDHLRAHPALAAEYAGVKQACAARHPMDAGAYTECKAPWIARILAAAGGGD
ncbi:GrpB family protein [Sphingomonas sp. Leaf412]|uniref:GrpB family protein n=1 Tax=Sphingomonas sp. Leaf412 TaxID=1736370 RepID=UPI001F203A95|nr:GrpB family protein [Sphingomonas sp. Leaf412]